MLPILRKLKIILKAFAFAALIWLLLLILPQFQFYAPVNDLLEENELFFYKRFFKKRDAHLHAVKELVIIDSVDPKEERPRSDYTEIIRRLAQSQAACIGADIRFTARRQAEDDSALAAAVAHAPRMVLPIDFAASAQQVEPSPLLRDRLRRFALPDSVARSFRFRPKASNVELPFDSLFFAVKRAGFLNFLRERYHALPLVIEYEHHLYPTLPFEIARANSEYHGKKLDITAIPRMPYAHFFVNFVPKDEFEYFTLDEAIELLRSRSDHFRDKIALLVNSGPEIPFVNTPLGSAPYPRWALHASVISQLLQHRHVKASLTLSMLMVAAVLLLVLLWNLFLSERLSEGWRRMRWAIVIGNAVFVVSAYLGLQFEQWLGVVTPALVFTLSLIAVRNDVHNVYQFPQYEDFSISVTEAQLDHYPVSIMHSPAGEEIDNVSFPKFFEQQAFAEAQGRLLQSSVRHNDLRQLGQQLYQAIFQGSIETRLLQSLGMIRKDAKKLRVQLRLDAPEVSRLPWEYVYGEGLATGFLALNRDLSLARYIPSAATTEQAEYRGPLRILVAIASPRGFLPLDVETEKKLIKKSLRRLLWLRQAKISFCEHATLEQLNQEITGGKYHVLHYIGHGAFDEGKEEGYLLLEDENGEPQAAEAEALGQLLEGSSIRLAVLNCCEGAAAPDSNTFYGVAQKLVKVGVPAVVAMQHKVRDDLALRFAETFYTSFLAYYSVDAAVTEARRVLMTRVGISQRDWGTPVLFMRADGAKIFRVKP